MANTIQASFGVDTSGFQAGMQRSVAICAEATGRIKGSLESIGATLGVGLGVGELVNFGREVFEFGSRIKDQSDAIGLSAEKFQQYTFAIEQSGGTQEAFTRGMGELLRKLEEAKGGGEQAVKMFDKLGITFDELQTLAPDRALLRIADALHTSGQSGAVTAAAMEALGSRVALKLIPALKDGAAAFENVGAAANVAGQDAIDAAEKAQDKWESFMRGVKVEGLNAFLALEHGWANYVHFVETHSPAFIEEAKENAALAASHAHSNAVGDIFEEGQGIATRTKSSGLGPDKEAIDRVEKAAAIGEKIREINSRTSHILRESYREGLPLAGQLKDLETERHGIAQERMAWERSSLDVAREQAAVLGEQEATLVRQIEAIKRRVAAENQPPPPANTPRLSPSDQADLDQANAVLNAPTFDQTIHQAGRRGLLTGGLFSGGLGASAYHHVGRGTQQQHTLAVQKALSTLERIHAILDGK